ncbi:secreted frizzled-related protein 2 [Arapaima gigas]
MGDGSAHISSSSLPLLWSCHICILLSISLETRPAGSPPSSAASGVKELFQEIFVYRTSSGPSTLLWIMRLYVFTLIFSMGFLPSRLQALHGMYTFGQADMFYKKSSCRAIPASLLLCRNIEYSHMRLPNLLGHETMDEILQQASSWIPLLQKQCHQDTKKFLCSLFAPVCLDDHEELIQPCRSLCEGVKQGCAPVMSAFGFPWPDMLDCARFPEDNDLCVPPAGVDGVETANRTVLKVCEPCQEKEENDNEILENLCKNDFALKIKVKEIDYMNGDTKIIPETKSRTIYKLKGVTERELKKAVLWLKDGLQCTCDEMNDFSAAYLVMGQKMDGHLVITSLKRWQRGQKEFKRISRSIRKIQC